MAFVKVLKTAAYFKRFQVARRRRREGKTDYYARRKMVRQDKNKFNNRKYRFVVRFSNKRVLKKFDLDEKFKGKEELDAEEYHVEDEENEQRPFKCILDVGLRRTCVGHRMWGALKGAVDGGLHIPHSTKNFPGFKPPEEKGQEGEYDAEAHKERIFGNHVKEYMEMLQEEDPTKYEAHFSKFIAEGIDADKMEDMYTEAHEKIREDPTGEPAEKKDITYDRDDDTVKASDGTEHVRSNKITLTQRKEKVAAKIAAAQAKMMEE